MRNLVIIAASVFFVACNGGDNNWDATGTFEATQVVVSAQNAGQLLSLDVTEGSSLKFNSVVGCIDTVQLYLKKMQLLASQQGALSKRSDIAKQIAATEQQIVWQTGERDRFEILVKRQAANQKQVDDIVNQLHVLNKQLEAQKSTLTNTNRSIGEESSAIAIQIAQIDDQLQRCRIVAPISGNVLIKMAEAGEFVSQGKPLFTLADMENVYLRAYITSDMLTKTKIGQQVIVMADFGDSESREYQGVVTWIADKAEFTPKTIQTRDERANQVYGVKISVKNDGFLKIGMYGEVKL